MPALADLTICLDFPDLPLHLQAMADDSAGPPHAAVYLPQDYDPAQTMPCLIYLQGGAGGDGANADAGRSIVGDRGWIVINLPLFKRSIDPLNEDEENRWRRLYLSSDEGRHIWACYEPMLQRIQALVPGLDPAQTCFGGFSNGAHSAANLLNADRPITDWAHHYCFIEGGCELERAERIPGQAIILQGDTWTGDQHDWLLPCARRARAAGCACTFERMAETGHAFPDAWKRRLADWLTAQITG